MPSLEISDLTLGDNKPATLEDKECVWEKGTPDNDYGESAIMMLSNGCDYQNGEMLFLRIKDGAFEVDDAFGTQFSWRPLENVKDLNEAKALCETLWRMR